MSSSLAAYEKIYIDYQTDKFAKCAQKMHAIVLNNKTIVLSGIVLG